ncbi:MAG: hypothetical protein LQ346_007981, partial [Caloplaca aetnensis]
MSVVYKNTKTLSFDDFIRDLHVSFGLSPSGLATMWDDSYGKCLVHQANDLHHAQLHPGEHLDDLVQKLLVILERRLDFDHVFAEKPNVIRGQSERTVRSLYDWCADVLVPAASVAFFGEALLGMNPELVDDFHAFDEDSWMLTYRYPHLLARKMHHGREANTRAFTRYFELALEDRPGACYYVKSFESRQRQAGMKARDIAITIQLFYWVTNANAYKICFWLLAYLLHQPTTLEAVKRETRGCFVDGKLNLESLLRSPLLNAAFDETLRLTSGAASARTVVAPTQLRSKTLRAGTKLLMPYRQLHFQESVFGPRVQEFHPDRFLGDKSPGSTPDFKPFGGGVTYCSGRFVARREVLAFVALMFRRYDVSLADPKEALPRLDEQKPTLGVIGPVKGDETTVLI